MEPAYYMKHLYNRLSLHMNYMNKLYFKQDGEESISGTLSTELSKYLLYTNLVCNFWQNQFTKFTKTP